VKGRLFFILAVLAFVALVPLVYYLLFERGLSVSGPVENPPRAPGDLKVAPTETPSEPQSIPMALSLTEARGKVEIGRRGKKWQTAEVGMVLEPKDRIRTDVRAQAVLSKPGVFLVELDSASEFEVKGLTEGVSRFLLQEGMLSADVIKNPGKRFEVQAAESVARTSGGAFKMGVDRRGRVALGTSRGEVEVEAEGKVIKVPAGYLTRISKGSPPQDPIKVPHNLFLKVRWPQKTELANRSLLVAGKTTPGARVRVGGAIIRVDSKGRFRQVVALKEGSNRLQVEAYDVGGNLTRSKSPGIVVDTRPDAFHIRTSPEMWKDNKKNPHISP